MVRVPTLIGLGLLVSLLVLLSCSSSSPTRGDVFWGDTLVLRLDELQKTSEVRYSVGDQAHYLVAPTSPDNELVMVRLTIWNARANKVIFTLDSDAAELRGFGVNEVYLPFDPYDRSSLVDQADSSETKFARPLPGCPDNLPCVLFLQGPMELPQNFQVLGWMIFEAPKGTDFRELKWKAADTVYLRF